MGKRIRDGKNDFLKVNAQQIKKLFIFARRTIKVVQTGSLQIQIHSKLIICSTTT